MGSGIIYAVIIVMWAAYFIPRWLRRHEELSETRSVEQFDHAMRVLSHRSPAPDHRFAVQGTRARVSPSLAVRRRRVLAALLLAVLATAVATPLSPAPWWAVPVALGLPVAYLVHLRLQVRSRHAVSRTRQSLRKRSRSRIMRFDAVERLMTVRRELAEERAAEERRWQEAEEAEARLRAEDEERRIAAEGGWSPVPVPLPTYVSKPMAPSRPTGGRAAATSAMGALLDDAEGADDELEAIIERRAVND